MNDLHGLLFAYRADANLGELTRPRNTCSLPFGGRYRLIDFMLSNYVNAGISDVGIIVHQNYQSLLDHLGSGKDWDLSRKHGGLRILPPFSYARRGGDYRGPMDALAGVSDYLNNIRQDYVIMGRGDLALNLPVADVFQQHLDSGADVTVVCTPTLRGAPRSSEYVEVSESGRITDLSIHPIAAGDQLESLELYYRVFFLGEEVPYRQGEPADITAPDGYASTWVGTGCVSDNANTYFIGHNPGVFERVMDLEIGDKITVFDDDGASRTYYVFDTLFLPNGSNYFVYEGRIAPTGETITLQTCTGDNQRVRCVMAR